MLSLFVIIRNAGKNDGVFHRIRNGLAAHLAEFLQGIKIGKSLLGNSLLEPTREFPKGVNSNGDIHGRFVDPFPALGFCAEDFEFGDLTNVAIRASREAVWGD